MKISTSILWQALLALGLGLLAWRITALGLASNQVRKLDQRGAEAARQALDWYPGQPAALFRQGQDLADSDASAATEKLLAAYRLNPTAPGPLLKLAAIALASGETARADAIITQVDRLRPSDAELQRDLGQYWLRRQQPERAFAHWSRAIAGNPALAPGLYESFRQLLGDPAQSEAFATLARDPPHWWADFFINSAGRGKDLTTLRRLYRLRQEVHGSPLTQAERQAYYERLLREDLIEEAYLAWVNSLTAAQRQYLGLLFDGSFELPLGGNGFAWRYTALDRVDVARARFTGEDENALRLRFNRLRTPFEHLSQRLFLAPGSYEVTGFSRGLNLISEGGFRWQALCQAPRQDLLGESRRIFATETWTEFRFKFDLPTSCTHQELRLVSADDRDREIFTDGELWFDKLGLRRLEAPAP